MTTFTRLFHAKHSPLLTGLTRLLSCLPLATWLAIGQPAAVAQSPSNIQLASAGYSGPAEEPVDKAIARGLAFLRTQQRKDGAITDRQYDTTMTSLAIMAFASTGTLPDQRDGASQVVRNALDFVLREDRQDKLGYYGNRDGSRMYGHGIVTLMLTEMLGMGADAEQDELIHRRCQAAINLILSAQTQPKPTQFAGGWRYTPNSNDSDLSVSVWQLMALRSAKNDGLDVPSAAIEQALAFLKRTFTQRPELLSVEADGRAGFSYLPNSRNPSFAMTAAGLLALQVCGQYDSPLASGATKWLEAHPPKWGERFFFYGTYYYAQGFHQQGGILASQANRRVADILLEHQGADGAWLSPGGEELGAGKVYATCMAILSLTVEYSYLPIYQR